LVDFWCWNFPQIAGLELLNGTHTSFFAQESEVVGTQSGGPSIHDVTSVCVFEGRRVPHESDVTAAFHQTVEGSSEAGKQLFVR